MTRRLDVKISQRHVIIILAKTGEKKITSFFCCYNFTGAGIVLG